MANSMIKSLGNGQAQDWAIYDENGNEALPFSSLLSFDIKDDGKVVSDPVEQGSFASYNKTSSPHEINIEIATEGTSEDAEKTLTALTKLREEPIKITLATPSESFPGLTLESFSYSKQASAGYNLLVVKLKLVEVREVDTNITTTVVPPPAAKNPDSASKTNTGKAGTTNTSEPTSTGQEEPKKKRSILKDMTG
jgi:hypothetical protein